MQYLFSLSCIVVITNLATISMSDEIDQSKDRKNIMYPFCWRGKFLCTYFSGPVKSWFGVGGCKGWCTCKGFQGGYCIARPPDKRCMFENWRCMCYARLTGQYSKMDCGK